MCDNDFDPVIPFVPDGVIEQVSKQRYDALESANTELCAEVERLRDALLEHRADLHNYSSRPCPTCRQSAQALGLSVRDSCALPREAKTQLDAGYAAHEASEDAGGSEG